MFCDLRDLAVFDRDVHHSVDVIFGVDHMPFVEQQIIGRKGGLGKGARRYEKRENHAALSDIFIGELLHYVVLD
jgi:hypothetical protein